jgi:UDP-N-acetylglucosamine transferase subunit ALG13
VPTDVLASGDAAAVFRFLFFGSVLDMTEDIRAVAADPRVDLVISDLFMPGAGLACELDGVTWMSVCCGPVAGPDAYRAFLEPHAAPNFDAATTRSALGLPAAPGENLLGRISPFGHLVPATRRFIGTAELPDTVALVGPLVPAGQPRPADNPPTVVVTSTTNTESFLGGRGVARERYLRTAASALADLPVRVLIVLPNGHPRPDDPPANVRTTGLLSREELDEEFDGAAAVVCHAGWGTVGRALIRGVPLVLVPLVGDQFHIAARCAELGVAVTLDPATLCADDLRDAVRAVCTDSRYRTAAARLAADFQAADPLTSAVAEVDALLTRRPNTVALR